MSIYKVVAINHAEASENRIHSDEIASRLGFRGALVPGVAVYGYMTHPLVERFGADWLSSHETSVRFLKPAYDGEELTIEMKPAADGWDVTCTSPFGELLAVMQSKTPCTAVIESASEVFSRSPLARERVLVSADTIDLERPLPIWHWHADKAGNVEYTAQVADDLSVYANYIHPHWALATANYILVRSYIMPAWIHVGSEIAQHRPFRSDTAIDIAAACVEKWERKGHEFLKLDIRYTDAYGLIARVLHTAIYKVAGA
jgi:acyl dehydratase